jgi:tetratricopeptide (TPR) repeat protein
MRSNRCKTKVITEFILAALACAATGCHRSKGAPGQSMARPAAEKGAVASRELPNLPGPCEVILAPEAGTGRVDIEIRRVQQKLREDGSHAQELERLGWLFVAKARESFDPGYYKLAEQCALCLGSRQPHSPVSLLLQGHVHQNLHRFKEAEAIACELVARRGASFDYGLLGDSLMEQGSLDEAAVAYQRMVDERPDLQAYARIAHLRWLKGDVSGAMVVMQLAADAASPNSPEAAAWVNTRLAGLQFQRGNLQAANEACDVALDYERDYAPALLLRGRLLLAEGRNVEAVAALQRAALLNPLPDYQWVLSEALRAANRNQDAARVEAALCQHGAAADPRTYALFLSSRGESPVMALGLARAELETRSDVFTHDALAWALAANGQIGEARAEMRQALAQGTRDARLFLHAGVIAARAGEREEARGWLSKVAPMVALLLPTEQMQLQTLTVHLNSAAPPVQAETALVPMH